MKDNIDKETQQVMDEQKQAEQLVRSDGWGYARAKLVERVLELQNAFNIEDSDAQMMLIDIRARKLATEILYDWLKEVEGTKEQYESNKLTLNPKPYIIREDLK